MSTPSQKDLDDYYKIEVNLFSPKRHQWQFMIFLTLYNVFFALYFKFEDV